MGLVAWLKGEEPGPFLKWLHSSDPGHFGEYLIQYALNSLPGYYKTLCNIYLPYKNRTSEIDVILLHETGIYVFESKNFSGWIFGNEHDQYWTQCLNAKTKNQFYNPILQNKTHIVALQKYLNLKTPECVVSYIVFSLRCELKKICAQSKNTFVLKRPDLLKSIRQEIRIRPHSFTRLEINQMYTALLPLTNITAAEKADHVEAIHKMQAEKLA